MKAVNYSLLFILVLSIPTVANAADSMLRITCYDDDVGAEVLLNGKSKGKCPVDIMISEGPYKLRAVKTVDDSHERVFEQDVLVGEKTIIRVEVVLSTRLNAAGQKREDAQLVVERAESVKREKERLHIEAQNLAETDAALAMLRQQGVEPGNGKPFRDCPDCPELVAIPPGSFEMGSNNGEANERPVHHIIIKRPFAMGKTEVTQGQWKAIMGNNPSSFTSCGDNCPVEQVSWDDAKKFIQEINAKTGKQYRLPSSAEWEYACRAGGQQEYCGSDNLDSVGWYEGNSGSIFTGTKNHPVATKQANAFGLYDMSGNVWEWVEDSYHDSYVGAPMDGEAWQGDGAKRVLRGGSGNNAPQSARAVHLTKNEPTVRISVNGFRLARMLP